MTKFPTQEAGVMIEGPAGKLQLLATPPKQDKKTAVCVICHPHPQMQGTMQNKVVTTIAKAMDQLGIPSVRFNFRGIGKSEGDYDGGVGEKQDVLAVLTWAKSVMPDRAVWLAGFSFGGAMAIEAATQFDITQLIAVAPSVVHFHVQVKTQPAKHFIVIQGEEDEVVMPRDVLAFVNEFDHPPELITLPECGHFFHGRLVDLRKIIIEKCA